MKGPFAIVCRGHSGGRLLAEAFRQNGFWMGVSESSTRDAEEFSIRHQSVRRLVEQAFEYQNMGPEAKGQAQENLRRLVEATKKNCPAPETHIAHGWKHAITVFGVEILLDAMPQARVIHLIRDGRDVMLSRLNSRMRQLDDPVNQLMVFGRTGVTEYRGIPLTSKAIKKYRNEIEMEHWVTAVRFGMRGRKYAGQYIEVMYEKLCTQPAETLTRVFDFLQVPFLPQARQWAISNASPQRIGKWHGMDGRISEAMKIGEPLLRELGYL